MTDRLLPPAPRYASCPYDEKILSYYEGQFDTVYVLLHPFLKPTQIDLECFSPESWPEKQEIIDGCLAVSWQEVLELSGLKTLSEVDVGLRTCINGLRKDLSSEEYSRRLIQLENQGIIHPNEGELPPLLENRILGVIKSLGHEWLWVGDELGTERKLHWIDDLIEKDELPSHGCVFTHDYGLLVATHWDSHCSFLCSSRKIIDEILKVEKFEGFFCTSKTEVYWGAYEI